MNRSSIFHIAHKEALYACILALLHFVWWFGFSYGLGSSSIEDYQYIGGFPAWFFYSSIVGTVLIIIAVIILVKYFFTDVPFDDDEGSLLFDKSDKSENSA